MCNLWSEVITVILGQTTFFMSILKESMYPYIPKNVIDAVWI